MEELGLFGAAFSGPQVMVAIVGEAFMPHAVALAAEFRGAGLRVDLYPSSAKMGKQFKYASERGVDFVALVGPDESASGTVSIKNLATREQDTVAREEAAAFVCERVGAV